MSVFEYKIRINPKGLTKTKEALFNEILDTAIAVRPDPKYNDEQHQIIYMINGDQYYFNSFKYVYPLKPTENFKFLYNNKQTSKIVKVELLDEDTIIVEEYSEDSFVSFKGEIMRMIIYKLPEHAKNFPALRALIRKAATTNSLSLEYMYNYKNIYEVDFSSDKVRVAGYHNCDIIYRADATESFYNDMIKAVDECTKDKGIKRIRTKNNH